MDLRRQRNSAPTANRTASCAAKQFPLHPADFRRAIPACARLGFPGSVDAFYASQNQTDLTNDLSMLSRKRRRQRSRRADTALIVADDFDDFIHVVGDFQKVEIAGADVLVLFDARFHPSEQALPMFAAEQDERELRDA